MSIIDVKNLDKTYLHPTASPLLSPSRPAASLTRLTIVYKSLRASITAK